MRASTNPVDIKNLGTAERWISGLVGAGLIAPVMKKRTAGRALLAILGGDLIYRGVSGYSLLYDAVGVPHRQPRPGRSASINYRQGIRVDRAVTIDKPRQEVYAFWRKLENLPRFMKHLKSVIEVNERISHWVAEAPAGKSVEWDAEIHNEDPNERIGWRSLPGSEVETAGSVQFKDAPGGRGTEVQVELQYLPPAGMFGAAMAKLLGSDPADQISEDLQRLKQLLESGETVTTEGQPSGRESVSRRQPMKERRAGHRHGDTVSEASEQSFPASDPPAWSTPKRDIA